MIDILPLYPWIDLSNINKPGKTEQSKMIRSTKADLVVIDQEKHEDHSKVIRVD